MYEADFHKPGIYGSGRVWANAWDVSRAVSRWARTPGYCGFRGVFWVRRDFVLFLFFPSKAHGLLQVRGRLASFTSLLVMTPFFAYRVKKPLHTGVRTGCHHLISRSICLCECVTFVVFTDCERCTRPISTNPGSMEAGEYGLTRGTCFVTRRLGFVVIAGLLWISWSVLGGAGFFLSFFFFERRRPAASMRPPLASFTALLVIQGVSQVEKGGASSSGVPVYYEYSCILYDRVRFGDMCSIVNCTWNVITILHISPGEQRTHIPGTRYVRTQKHRGCRKGQIMKRWCCCAAAVPLLLF